MARKAYRMTPRRRAALRKAQLASARKRRRGRNIKRAAVIGGGAAVLAGGLAARHKLSGSSISIKKHGPLGEISGSVSGSHGRSIRKHGNTIRFSGRKKGPLGSHRSVVYTHNKVDTKVLGTKIRGAPRSVVGQRPPNAVQRRRMSKFNYAHTAEQKSSSAMRFKHTGRHGQNIASKTISEAEAMRRTSSYMESVRRPTTAKRNKALKYYRSQPRYDAKGSVGRRGRARSRELRNR